MASFGEQLKRERKLRKVTLDEIAEATKISVRYLRALEGNDFSQLPGGVFDRGFVRAYAQFVGLDEEATVEAYLAERGPEQVQQRDDGLDALRNPAVIQPEALSSSGGGKGNPQTLRRIAVVAVAVGLLSVTAWAVSRYFQSDGTSPAPPRQTAQASAQAAVQQPVPPPPVPEATPEPVPEATPEPEPEVEVMAQANDPAPSPPVATQREEKKAKPLIDARILVDRAATGRINCDNRQVEMLDGLRPGTVLKFQCQRFLLLNVRDGGAVRVGLNGETPLKLTADGQPLDNYGIYP